jgi:hypothetical protein
VEFFTLSWAVERCNLSSMSLLLSLFLKSNMLLFEETLEAFFLLFEETLEAFFLFPFSFFSFFLCSVS